MLSVCLVCVCVFSVCVCVHIHTDGCHANHANHISHLNLHPTQFPYLTVLLCCSALPTRSRQKSLSTCFCLPADKATVKSVKNNSPTDSEMQTAIASKDKGIFFDKAFAVSNTYNVSQTPSRFGVAPLLVMVCV